jgi:hypothetical protein
MISDKIRPYHLERKALLYVRQSSAHQVLHNRESSALQYAMQGRLTVLGWSEIEVIDGRSRALGGGLRPACRLRASHHQRRTITKRARQSPKYPTGSIPISKTSSLQSHRQMGLWMRTGLVAQAYQTYFEQKLSGCVQTTEKPVILAQNGPRP